MLARLLVENPASAAARGLATLADRPLEGRVLPGRRIAVLPKSHRWSIFSWRQIVVLAAGVTAVVLVITIAQQGPAGGTSPAQAKAALQTIRLEGGATVSGRMRQGQITATELSETPDLGLADPLGKPIRVSAGGGGWDGPATISFPVKVADGLDPAKDVGIAMRSPDTGGHWVYVGGSYDPATGRVSVNTTHFSDWIPFARDLHNLAGKAIQFFSGLVRDSAPGTNCQGKQKGTVVKDSVKPGLSVCLSDSGELQFANPHGFPITLTLPAGITGSSDNSGQTLPESVWVSAVEAAGGGSVLLPGSERAYTADFNQLDKNKVTITAAVDIPTFVFDMADFLAELVMPLDLNSPEGKTLVTPTKELMTCVRSSAYALENRTSIGSFLQDLGELIKTCYGPAAKDLVNTVLPKLKVIATKEVLDFLFRPLDLLFNFDYYRHTANEALSTAEIIATGGYSAKILLLPSLDQDKTQSAAQAATSGNCQAPWGIRFIPIIRDAWTGACKAIQALLP